MKKYLPFLTALALAYGSPARVSAEPIFGLTSTGQLVRFDTDDPGTLFDTNTISGLQSGESLLGVDFRPATGELFGVADTGQIYSIIPGTGAATPVGSTPAISVNGTAAGIDFNPVVDRIRFVTDQDQNVRLNPNNGALAGTDVSIAYAAGDVNDGDNATIVCAAYTNNFTGSTSTTLFGIDSTNNALVTIGSEGGTPTSPNTGQLFTEGLIGVDVGDQCGFDISNLSGRAFIANTVPAGTTTTLYQMDFGTGNSLANLGAVNVSDPLVDIALPFEETTVPTLAVTTPSGSSVSTRRRRFTFIGTAADNTGVQEIQFRTVRNGSASAWRTASGTESWTFDLSPRNGRQNVQIKAIDIYGNESSVVTIALRKR